MSGRNSPASSTRTKLPPCSTRPLLVKNIHGTEPKEGKIELIADCDGLLKIDRKALLAVNSTPADDDRHDPRRSACEKGSQAGWYPHHPAGH